MPSRSQIAWTREPGARSNWHFFSTILTDAYLATTAGTHAHPSRPRKALINALQWRVHNAPKPRRGATQIHTAEAVPWNSTTWQMRHVRLESQERNKLPSKLARHSCDTATHDHAAPWKACRPGIDAAASCSRETGDTQAESFDRGDASDRTMHRSRSPELAMGTKTSARRDEYVRAGATRVKRQVYIQSTYDLTASAANRSCAGKTIQTS